MSFAHRTHHLVPEGAYEVLRRAQALEASGREIIHLEIGQPDFDTYEYIKQAGMHAIRDGLTRYTHPSGMPSLREAIAEDAGRRRGIHIDPLQVVVSPGAKPNLFFPTLALIQPGDEVIYPNPGFPTYEAMIRVAGGVPLPVPLRERDNFSFDLAAFDQILSPRTRLIILNSPANPTGGVMPLSHLEHIAEAARQHDCWVMSDEIYSRIVYDPGGAPSIASLPGMLERTIIVDGFSKTYSMTGWRLGFGIMPLALAETVGLLLTHSVGSTAHFVQAAGVEALTASQEQVDIVVAEYRRRRDALVDGLNAIPGVTCQRPQGAFYAFPNVKSFGRTSADLARHLLDQAGVAVLPGSDFGEFGEGYLRLVYSNSMENIQRAVSRMGEALASL